MALESVTFISDLVATNPVNATDQVAQGDDHIRNIKAALLASFPGVTGAVLSSHTELNYLDGATGITGTGNTVRSISPTFTGTPVVPDAWLTFAKIQNADAVSVLGRSANSSGVLDEIAAGANDRILRRVSNALDFGQLTAGMFPSTVVPDAALSANVPLLNAANTFTANQTVGKATPKLVLNETNGAQFAAIQFMDGGAHRGYVGMQTGADQFITGTAADAVAITSTAGIVLSGDGTSAHFALSSAGLVTTPNASAAEVGIKGAVARAVSSSGNTAASDSGNCVLFNGGSGQTFTLDADVPTNGIVVLVNESGNSWTIAASGTLIFANVTGSRTLPTGCMAVAYHRQGSGTWQIAGQLT